MRRIGVVGAALLCLATACATPLPVQRLAPDDPRPRLLLYDWLERTSQRQRLRALARLAVEREDGSLQLRARQLVIAERPSSLRVEVLGFLNQSLALIATDGARFEVYRAEDQSYEAGEVHDRLLWDEAGIDLSPAEAVAVLLGAPTSDRQLVLASASLDGEGRIRIDLADHAGAVVQRVRFDSEGQLRALEVLDDSEAIVWSARFDDYREVGGAAFAHAIELDVGSGATSVEISLRSVELNPDLSPELFRLLPDRQRDPSGAGADGR